MNLQVPAGQAPGQVLTEVRVGGQVRSRSPLTVIPTAPGIFAVANRDGRVNTVSVPAHPGEVLHIYATGQVAVIPAVDDACSARQPCDEPQPSDVFLADALRQFCITDSRRLRRSSQIDVTISGRADQLISRSRW